MAGSSAGGAGDAAGGAQADDNQAAGQAGAAADAGDPPKTVSWDDHQRALGDMHRFKKAQQDAQKKLGELEAQIQQSQQKALQEKQDWKTLAEQNGTKAKDWEDKYKGSNQAFINTLKHQAVQMAAVKQGLRPEAEGDLDLVPMDDIECELTDGGRFIVRGADGYVADLKKKKAHWFKDAAAPIVNGGGARGGGAVDQANLTATYMLELEKKDPVKFRQLWPKYQQQVSKRGRATT